MQTVRWLTFCVSNALTRTVVHFFPSSGNVTAPYPTSCTLTIFGKEILERSVTMEGARLSQPDGVRLEEVFPTLKAEQTGTFGLWVELSTQQPRIDLAGSMCMIELAARGHSVRFLPKRVDRSSLNAHGFLSTLILKDALNYSSLVVVNAANFTLQSRASILHMSGQKHEIACKDAKAVDLTATSVHEHTISDLLDQDVEPLECSFGLLRSATLGLKLVKSDSAGSVTRDGDKILSESAAFVVYRDVVTKRPLSVCAL